MVTRYLPRATAAGSAAMAVDRGSTAMSAAAAASSGRFIQAVSPQRNRTIERVGAALLGSKPSVLVYFCFQTLDKRSSSSEIDPLRVRAWTGIAHCEIGRASCRERV